MKQLKIIIDFLIESNIWVAISVVALLRISNICFDIYENTTLQLFVFSSVVFGYNFMKHFTSQYLLDIKLMLSDFSLTFFYNFFKGLNPKKKLMFTINLISVVISFICFFKLKLYTQLLVFIPLLLSIFYTISFGNKTLRNVEGLKIYVVAITWSIVTVLLPFKNSSLEFSVDFFLVFVQRFLFVVVLILPFEIRDFLQDPEQLRTVPQKIGIQKTKIYGFFLLLLFFGMEFFKINKLDLNSIIILIVTLLFLLCANEKQSKYYSSFFIEGIPIMWFVTLLIF